MKFFSTFAILTLFFNQNALRAQRNLLCLSDNVSVYYQIFPSGQENGLDKWQVNLEVVNESKHNLFYKSHSSALDKPIILRLQKSSTGKSPEINGQPLLAPFLEITVSNAPGVEAYRTHFIHGEPTMILTTDTTTILKVGQGRNLFSFDVLMNKNEVPSLNGHFVQMLVQREEVRRKKNSKP